VRGVMNPEPVTYWFCGKCEADYRSEEEAEKCCGGSPQTDVDNQQPPTTAELEALGQLGLL
jgi:hypothetical protein